MDSKYFTAFLEIEKREEKPRDVGLTFVGDSGSTLAEAKEKLELIGDYIDLVKFVMVSRRFVPKDYVKKKVKIYQEKDIITFPGGVLTELAIIQDKYHEFLKELQDVGFDAVEVSVSEMRTLPLATHCRLVEIAAEDYGFKVLPEIGIHAPYATGLKVEDSINEIEVLLKSGAWRVVIEGAELLAMGVGKDPSGTRDIRAIVEAVGGFENLIFEVNYNKPLMNWLIDNYGPNVNLGNICLNLETNLILEMEGARRKIVQTIVNSRIPSSILKL